MPDCVTVKWQRNTLLLLVCVCVCVLMCVHLCVCVCVRAYVCVCILPWEHLGKGCVYMCSWHCLITDVLSGPL